MNITFSPTELGEVDALLLLNTNEVPTEAFSEHRTVSLIATGQTVAEGQLTDSFVYGHGQTPSVLVLMDDHADDDANDTNDYMARVLLGLPTLIDELNSRTDYRISAVSADTGCPLSGFVFGDSDSSASGLARSTPGSTPT